MFPPLWTAASSVPSLEEVMLAQSFALPTEVPSVHVAPEKAEVLYRLLLCPSSWMNVCVMSHGFKILLTVQELGLRPSCDSRSLTRLMGFDRVARTVNRFQSALTCALQLNAGAEPSAFPGVCEPSLGLSQNIFSRKFSRQLHFLWHLRRLAPRKFWPR